MPVFVLDPRLLDGGRFPSANRAWFLLASLRELREALRDARRRARACAAGSPRTCCRALAAEAGAEAVYFASDVSPFAMARDRRVVAALGDVEARRHPGNFVADVGAPRTGGGRPYAVFSPFHRAWEQLPRRDVHGAPRALSVPSGARPPARSRTGRSPRPPSRSRPARRRRASGCARWLATASSATPSATTGSRAARRSSRPTCTSAASRRARSRSARGRRAARARRRSCASSPGATSTRTCCCTTRATRAARTSARFDALEWEDDADALDAWRDGPHRLSRSSTPACASSLHQGWMHNRARLIVALVPHQGPAPRLAAGRGALHAPPAVRRRGAEQRQLAVDHVDRRRSRAVLPAPVQPDRPAARATTRTAPTCAAGAPSCATCRSSGSPSRGR